MKIPFVKMHGLGNDFVVIDDLGKLAADHSPINAKNAQMICDRHFGVGCDQILWLKDPKDKTAHARMEIVNPDGSPVEMCGNGIRAVALYLKTDGPSSGLDAYSIETPAGLQHVKINGNIVEVNMGVPRLQAGFENKAGEPIQAAGQDFRFFEVSMGNPHAVIFVGYLDKIDLPRLGREVEIQERFPDRTNVEFAQIKSKDEILLKVWERGAGATLACGSGACATAAAAIALGKVGENVNVDLPGGRLQIVWKGPGKPMFMTGPAQEVFRGEIELAE